MKNRKNESVEKKKIILPKIHKKKIVDFIHEFEKLASERKFIVTIPSQKVNVMVKWQSDNSLDFDFDNLKISRQLPKEIIKENKKIKSFCYKVSKWSKLYFKDRHWIWDKVFWHYNPELGESFFEIYYVEWE